MSNAIVINAENVLNLDNVTLANFLKEQGVKGFSRVSKANRDAAEAAAKAFFAKVTGAEGATAGALETAREGVFHFPTAASAGATGTAVVVHPEGWKSVEGGGSDAEAASATDAQTDAQTDGETEAEAAARIEAEAAAESGTDEEKAERKARAAARASNSVGVALSWRNPEVRTARLTRDGVKVTDSEGNSFEFKSVAEAFRTLRLPFEKHIKFRLALKASRKEVINGFTFEM